MRLGRRDTWMARAGVDSAFVLCLTSKDFRMRLVPALSLSAFLSILLCALPLPASAVVLPPLGAILDANFDDKPVGQPIGTGGAALGEPVALSNLTTTVIDTGGGNRVLQVDNDLSSTNARRLRWAFLDDQEVAEGPLIVRFTLRASLTDRFSILLREALGGSTQNFLSVSFSANGTFGASDAAGTVPLSANTYSANVDHAFELRYDMDAGTYQILLDGTSLVSGRAHGIVDRGIGALVIGYQSSSAGSRFFLDELLVEAALPPPQLDVVLDAPFDDKPLGQAIGSGGARLGEPSTIESSLTTEIVDSVPGERALRVTASPQPFTQNIRWQLLDDIEVTSGVVLYRFGFRAGALDNYAFLFRESGTSTRPFLNVELRANGEIAADDANGSLGVIGTYSTGVTHQFGFLFDMDAGTMNIIQDNMVLVSNRAHGIADRGIGGLLTGFDSSATGSAGFVLESILVRASDVRGIPAAMTFLQQPSNVTAGASVDPAVDVGAVNIFDEPVPDATMVALSRVSGNSGVTLSGNHALTVAGAALFPDLSLDLAGSYVLRASAALASVDSAGFVVSAGAPASLSFTTQPADGASGVPIAPSPRVLVSDEFGNPVVDGTAIQLVIESGPKGAVLTGGSATTSTGLASFSSLSLDLPGTYVLHASAGAAQGLSEAFAIVLAPPTQEAIFASGFEQAAD